MTQMTVAATQMACGWDRDENIARGEKLVAAAAEKGAGVILLQELFETPYFCKDTEPDLMHLAVPANENPAVQHFRALSAKYEAVLPISTFERWSTVLGFGVRRDRARREVRVNATRVIEDMYKARFAGAGSA